MLEIFGGGIVGSLLGGLFRLAPEVLKFFDRKNERMHELKMFEQQCQLENMRSQNRLQEIGAMKEMAVDVGVIGALKSVIDQQTEMVKAAGGWVAALSASVRPVLTYYLLFIYGFIKACYLIVGFQSDAPLLTIVSQTWGVDDVALLSGVINYWMMDRTLAKRGLA